MLLPVLRGSTCTGCWVWLHQDLIARHNSVMSQKCQRLPQLARAIIHHACAKAPFSWPGLLWDNCTYCLSLHLSAVRRRECFLLALGRCVCLFSVHGVLLSQAESREPSAGLSLEQREQGYCPELFSCFVSFVDRKVIRRLHLPPAEEKTCFWRGRGW